MRHLCGGGGTETAFNMLKPQYIFFILKGIRPLQSKRLKIMLYKKLNA